MEAAESCPMARLTANPVNTRSRRALTQSTLVRRRSCAASRTLVAVRCPSPNSSLIPFNVRSTACICTRTGSRRARAAWCSVQAELASLEPGLATGQDVRPVLLGRVCGLFCA